MKNMPLTNDKRWKLNHAIQLYQEGRVTKARAAEMAGISLYDMMDILRERAIPMRYSLDEALEDMKAMLNEASASGVS